MTKKTIIIVPCFNEVARLDGNAFLDFLRHSTNVGIIFVDDGSTDGTSRILDGLCSKSLLQTQWMRLERNSGKAEAVRQGFLKAFELSPEYVAYLDADLSAPLSCILELERLVNGKKEVALASRVRLLGRHIERDSKRHFLGRIFATVVSLVLHLPIYDTQCGAKLFKMTPRLKKVFSFPFTVRWIFDVEIFARFLISLRLEGREDAFKDMCVEHPLQEWVERKGSKIKCHDFFVSALDVWKIHSLLNDGKRSSYSQKLI